MNKLLLGSGGTSDKVCISFTASTSGNSINLFYSSLKNFNTSDYDVYINGAKTSQVFNSLTFSANDKIKIKANKDVKFYPYFYPSNKNYIKSIDSAFPLMSTDNSSEYLFFMNLFTRCTSLTSIPQDLFKYNVNITQIGSCFQQCSSLLVIPIDLFKYNTKLAGVASCFSECSSLTSIPKDLFKYNTSVIYFNYCFENCTSLTTIPTDLFKYNTNAIGFNNCFYNCSNVTSAVPELWVSHPNANHTKCFYKCTKASNYSSIPSKWK